MFWNYLVLFSVTYCGVSICSASNIKCECALRLRVEGGWVCGSQQRTDDGVKYASFKGIPYAQQPVGKLRFKELLPVKPWRHYLDATHEGPICPQFDEIYGALVRPERGMSEACIYVNVYVPIASQDTIQSNYFNHRKVHINPGLPILVMIPGGGFQAGSGDSDLYGPEYLVKRGVIVITFNYRINVFGFLSLNTSNIPGNAGIRDQLTLLHWVQRNAKAFGGDPTDVTLMGQSTGATCAHLLSLSEAAKGLFRKVILMSGTGVRSYFSATPLYAKTVATLFLTRLGIYSTDPDYIHQRLIDTPLEKIMEANRQLQYEIGFITFSPVVESKFPGVTRIIDDEPEALMERGRGNEYPLIIGINSDECAFFKFRMEYLNLLERIKQNPVLILPLSLAYAAPQDNITMQISRRIRQRYFDGKPTYDKYKDVCSDEFFVYPAFVLARARAAVDSAPVYMYEFSYASDYSSVKLALHLDKYNGSTHVEDMTYVFNGIAMLEHGTTPVEDELMKDWMTMFITNFMRCDNPTCSAMDSPKWPPVYDQKMLNYQQIHTPQVYSNTKPTDEQWDMIKFYDSLWNARTSSVVIKRRNKVSS